MMGVVLNGKSVDLKSLNQALESQLNKLLKHSDSLAGTVNKQTSSGQTVCKSVVAVCTKYKKKHSV